ncbi:MAG: CHRD domain-containing protein [Solirubrobacteraceae bacterium]
MTANQGVIVRGQRFAAGAAAVAMSVAGCGGTSSHGHATASASRPLHVYRVTMSGRAERPHGAPHGIGVGVIAIHGGSVVCWRFAHLHGFVGATVAHIHTGPRGTPGPVLIPLSTAPALHHQGCTHASAAAITAIEHDPSGHYVNVHSARYPAGAVRGQL